MECFGGMTVTARQARQWSFVNRAYDGLLLVLMISHHEGMYLKDGYINL
jgi:hypothetical protein